MAKVYNIPELPDVVEVIKLISNTDKWKQRMAEMADMQADIQADIAMYEKHMDIEQAVGMARSKLAEAEGIRKQADEYAATRKAEADREYAAGLKRLGEADEVMRDNQHKLQAEAERIADVERRLDSRDGQLQAAYKELEVKVAQAQSMMESGKRMREVYEEKLKQLKSVTEG